jgi:hypothetical protein
MATMTSDDVKAPTNTPIPVEALPTTPRNGGLMESEDLDAAINAAAGIMPEEKPAAAAATATPAAAPAVATPATPPAKAAPAAQPAAAQGAKAATAEPAKPPKKEGIAELRDAHERATRKAQELEASLTATAKEKADAYAKIADLDTKLASYEKRIKEEFEPAVKLLSEREKQLQAKEERIRILDYQSSDEFHSKYVEPLATARAEADEFVGQLVVANAEGGERPATDKDFDAVLVQPNPQAAARLAKQLFGEDVYQSVMAHRMKLLSLERARTEAVKNAHIASAKWVEQTQVQQTQARQQFKSALTTKVEQMLASEPEVFKHADDDGEAKAALAEGQQFADALLEPPQTWTPEDFVDNVAKGRSRIIAYPKLRLTIARQAAELTNLKKQLEGYMKSEPTVETRNGGQQAAAFASGKEAAEAALDAAIMAVAR